MLAERSGPAFAGPPEALDLAIDYSVLAEPSQQQQQLQLSPQVQSPPAQPSQQVQSLQQQSFAAGLVDRPLAATAPIAVRNSAPIENMIERRESVISKDSLVAPHPKEGAHDSCAALN